MSWDEFNQAPDTVEDPKEVALNRAVLKALEGDAQELLRKHLFAIAHARSYVPGRSAEAVAWAEGYRALALELLTRGQRIKP